jgi:hypothetical protein
VADSPAAVAPVRSYGCTYGCGNPYDFVLISVVDGTTEFLCLPCLINLSVEMVNAVNSPDSPEVQAMLAAAGTVDQAPMTVPGPKPGKRNAPVTAADDDLIQAFDSRLTYDEVAESLGI